MHHAQAHTARADSAPVGAVQRPWRALGIVTLVATAADFAGMGLMYQLEVRGAALAVRLALPLTFLSLACEACLLTIAALFAAWGANKLEAKQLALLVFSFISTASIAAWRAYEAVAHLWQRRGPHGAVTLTSTPLPETYSLERLISGPKAPLAAQSTAAVSTSAEVARDSQ